MAESYKDILGFTWKREGDKYVQYRGDGSKTGKTKPYTAKNTSGGAKTKTQKSRGSGAKNKGKKVDLKNPQVGDTKKTPRRRVGKKWEGGETLVWTGVKWVPKAEYKKITPDRVGKVDLNSREYKQAKEINERVSNNNNKEKEEKENTNKNNNNSSNNNKSNNNNNNTKKVVVKEENSSNNNKNNNNNVKEDKPKNKLKIKERKGYVRDKGRFYSAKSAQGRKVANKLKAKERAKEMARKRKEAKQK